MKTSALMAMCIKVVLCILGIIGNSALIFHSVPKLRRRLEPYKLLMINLAVSNLLTNCMVDLPSCIEDIYGGWFMGEIYCKIFSFMANLSATSSILTTLIISVLWYRKLVKSNLPSNDTARLRELHLLSISIILSWSVAILFSVPLIYYCFVKAKRPLAQNNMPDEETSPKEFLCHDYFPSPSHKYMYEVIYLTLANVLPIALMVFTNVKMVIVLLRNRKRVSNMKCCRMARGVQATAAPNGSRQQKMECSSSALANPNPCGRRCSTQVLSASCTEIEDSVQIPQVLFDINGNTYYSFLSDAQALVSIRANACLNNVGISNRYIGELAINMTSSRDKGLLFQSPLKSQIFSISGLQMDNQVDLPVGISTLQDGRHTRQRSKTTNTELDKISLTMPGMKIVEVAGICEETVVPHVNAPFPVHFYGTQNKPRAQFKALQMPAINQCPLASLVNAPLHAVLQGPKSTGSLVVNVGQTKAKHKRFGATTQFRATISIMAVVAVFSISWITYLALRITSNMDETRVIINIANQIAASYTSIIPFIFLYGMNKCSCGFLR